MLEHIWTLVRSGGTVNEMPDARLHSQIVFETVALLL